LVNKPLNSSEQGKILIFLLLLAPSILFIAGIIPVIFLLFGFYMMRKNQDFSSIETAVRYVKGYYCLFSLGSLCLLLFWLLENGYHRINAILGLIALIILPLCYLISVHFLLLSPLKKHSDWVSVNDIFSNQERVLLQNKLAPKMENIKDNRSQQHSVADELIKWVQLKEDGHISDSEFENEKEKLLK
jgi:hypothetical protein